MNMLWFVKAPYLNTLTEFTGIYLIICTNTYCLLKTVFNSSASTRTGKMQNLNFPVPSVYMYDDKKRI